MSGELYKKFRPKSLERMIGNEQTINALSGMLTKGRLPHSILFSGPSGCGKTTLARILAKELQCAEMDFCEMNCSSFRGIDTVRDIMRIMPLGPTGGPCRVWILDEVHQLSRDGQNAALKMLEDTPGHCYFFLCTTDPQKLLPTILTRCSHMPVRLLNDAELTRLIDRVAKKEEIKLKGEVASDLISYAAGSARMALVLLDKIRNLPQEEQQKALEEKAAEQREAIDLCRALIKGAPWNDVAKILRALKGEAESTRWAVLGYARSVLLGKKSERAYAIILAFENNFFDTKDAGLARACFEVCVK